MDREDTMADLEKAKREMRWAKSAADDRRWDQLEPKIQTIEEALKGVPDADAAPVLAELQPLKEKLIAGVREEKAGRIEREIRRNLSAAADDLSRGYKESPQLPKTIARLESAEAREVLSPDTLAKLQAEIAALQGKSGGGAPPPSTSLGTSPPPPPKPVPAADNEKARLLQGDFERTLRMAVDEVQRSPSQGESYVNRLTAKLDADDAKANLPAETMQKLRGQLAELKAKVDTALREEKAAAIEREIKRNLSAAADELDRGYKESPQLVKAIARLNSPEAREVLSAGTVAKLEAEIAPLQAKSTIPPAPPPSAPLGTSPAPKPSAAPASKPTPAAAPAASAMSEQARLLEADIARGLRFVAGDIDSNPHQCGPGLDRAAAKLDSDEAKQHLPPESMQKLRAQLTELQAKFNAWQRAQKVGTLEDFIGRFIRNAEEDFGHNRGGAERMLENAVERLGRSDAKELLSAETVSRFNAEIARVRKLHAAALKKDGLDRATPILQELEQRVAKPIFDGSRQAWQVLGDLDALKSRVRGALYEIPKDDADIKAIETRIAAVDANVAGQTAKLGREEAHARVAQVWDIEKKAIEGWEQESGGDAKAPTYELPRTAVAVHRLTYFQNDKDLQAIGKEYKDDKAIQGIVAEAKKIREAAVAKLHDAFNALLAHLEKGPRPADRFGLEKPSHLAGQAGSQFEGTPHKEANVARAKGLYDRWQAEIEADRKARQAKYDELSAKAAAAWPAILSKIKAEEEFDPTDARSKGKTVLIKELRNRIGWDFSGAYDFAIWVGETPVVGNYDKTVSAAVEAACEATGLPLDDHTDWDAVLVLGAPGKIKQRFQVTVRDRSNLEIGRIEEWRPVDCVMCTVIALRAGPAAAGPKS